VSSLFESVNSVDSFGANLEPRLAFEKMAGCQTYYFAVIYKKNILCHVIHRIT